MAKKRRIHNFNARQQPSEVIMILCFTQTHYFSFSIDFNQTIWLNLKKTSIISQSLNQLFYNTEPSRVFFFSFSFFSMIAIECYFFHLYQVFIYIYIYKCLIVMLENWLINR